MHLFVLLELGVAHVGNEHVVRIEAVVGRWRLKEEIVSLDVAVSDPYLVEMHQAVAHADERLCTRVERC